MVDEVFVVHKIELIREGLEKLKVFEKKTFDEIAKDWMQYHAVKNILMEIIGRAIDVNQHLIAELSSPKIEAPLEYRQTFSKLVDLKILPEEFAEKIALSAGFRNAIVHGYNKLNEQTVYHSIGEAVSQYGEYCKLIFKLLEKK